MVTVNEVERSSDMIKQLNQCSQNVASWLVSHGQSIRMTTEQRNRLGSYALRAKEFHEELLGENSKLIAAAQNAPGMSM